MRLSRHVRATGLAVAVALLPSADPRLGSALPDGPGAAGAHEPSSTVERSPQPFVRRPDPGSNPADETGSVRPPSPAALTGYVWPLPRGRLTLPFGPSRWGSRLVDGARFHDGIDLATFCGDRIVAAHAGVVLAAGRRYDEFMGWQGDLEAYYARLDDKRLWMSLPIVVVIDDGNAYRSLYAHFSKVVVRSGEVVEAGQLLGYEGDTGRASGCHLHYGLFSPLETAVFEIAPEVVDRMKLPTFQTARIDPLLVLPPRPAATPARTGESSEEADPEPDVDTGVGR